MKKTESLHTALRAAIVALNDWTCTYAPEFCSEQHVKAAQERVNEFGTLYYIASVTKQCTDALKENEAENLQVNDRVRFVKTGEPRLDYSEGVISGFYGADGIIVNLISMIEGYNPSMVISRYCLTKV
jgi:hypothetical protein